jgi:hypothetical protein
MYENPGSVVLRLREHSPDVANELEERCEIS